MDDTNMMTADSCPSANFGEWNQKRNQFIATLHSFAETRDLCNRLQLTISPAQQTLPTTPQANPFAFTTPQPDSETPDQRCRPSAM
jgi:hypothetical protein